LRATGAPTWIRDKFAAVRAGSTLLALAAAGCSLVNAFDPLPGLEGTSTGAGAGAGGGGGGGVGGGALAGSGGTPSGGRAGRLSAGELHSCATTETDVPSRVRCWGSNELGELGFAATSPSRAQPRTVQAETLPLAGVEAIASGGRSSCALVAGRVHCWGHNGSLELGTMTTETSAQRVPEPFGASAVCVGGGHACAIATDGKELWCWGRNNVGQVGTGALSPPAAPSVVALPAEAFVLGCGETHTCAVIASAETPILCWGYNVDLQLGNDARPRRSA
jgi:hypothetical protein